MNKAAIKRFAVWARTKLMADIRTRLGFVGITEDEVKTPLPSSTKEIQYFQGAGTEPVSVKGKNILARKDLAEKLQKDAKRSDYKTAYENLVETTASAWFNRLIAIRFMEVNDYLSDGIRMLSSAEAGKTDPDIVTAPFDSDLEFTEAEKEKIVQCKLNSETDRAFRILFFKRCHQLQEILPGLFEKEGDATEFLMRLSVVDTDGVIYHLVHDIPEEDFRIAEGGQVEIIGWMYQYYNSALNELVYDGNLSKEKIPKHLISAATTIYTTDWIMRYMVENSLGRLWIEHLRAKAPDTDEKATAEHFGWKYYLPEAKQKEAVEKQLMELRKSRSDLKLEEIRCIDPCMGSGHILSYLFDVLMQIYQEEGYDARDAVEQIVTKNLYGLDIDDRAGQLAYFTVMMKARQYDRGFFRRKLQPNVQAIQESNGLQTWKKAAGDSMLAGQLTLDDQYIQIADELIETFHDAKEYGSLLTVNPNNYDGLLDCIERIKQEDGNLLFSAWMEEVEQRIEPLIKQAKVFSMRYDVVVTNPPYMGSNRFNAQLSKYVKKHYPNEKSDLAIVMLKRALQDTVKDDGYVSFITTSSWMSLSSFEKFRSYMFNNCYIDSLVDCGTELFDGKVGHNPIVAWVNRKTHLGYKMTAIRLVDYCYSRRNEKEEEFLNKDNYYYALQENFAKIPGAPVAYWVSETVYNIFDSPTLQDIEPPRFGMSTSDNNRFVRIWHEVSLEKFAFPALELECVNISKKWYPYNNGGEFRRWFGDNGDVVNWEHNGAEIKAFGRAAIRNKDFYYKSGITWTSISSSKISVRAFDNGFLFSSAGFCIFEDNLKLYILALMNCNVGMNLLQILSPTINFNVGDIARMPVKVLKNKRESVEQIADENVSISKKDWDSFETSWDFKRHPLV